MTAPENWRNDAACRKLLKQKQPALSAALELAADLVASELSFPEEAGDVSTSEGS